MTYVVGIRNGDVAVTICDSRVTEKIFNRQFSGKLPQNIQRVARKKLVIIDAAPGLNDLRILPGNQLEALEGDRKGQHSIRINDPWRICFKCYLKQIRTSIFHNCS